MRKQIAAANWKMNLTLKEGISLLSQLAHSGIRLSPSQWALFALPFPYLQEGVTQIKQVDHFEVAAQNCSDKASGAYTGEVSAGMLQSLGVGYCLVGHSERRQYFHEGDSALAAKIDRCLSSAIAPIFCCGEALDTREAGAQNPFVENQLRASLFHLSPADVSTIIIAYEPIWAIGTGKTASTDQAQEMHAFIRSVLAGKFGAPVAEKISILYGGSVKPNNAKEIFACPDVDGGLVGGASLSAADFAEIIRSLQ